MVKNSKYHHFSVLVAHFIPQFVKHSPLPKLVTVLGHPITLNSVLNDFDVIFLGFVVVEDLNYYCRSVSMKILTLWTVVMKALMASVGGFALSMFLLKERKKTNCGA